MTFSLKLIFSLKPEVKSCFIHFAFFDKELRIVAQLYSMFNGKEFFNTGSKMQVRSPNSQKSFCAWYVHSYCCFC